MIFLFQLLLAEKNMLRKILKLLLFQLSINSRENILIRKSQPIKIIIVNPSYINMMLLSLPKNIFLAFPGS